MTTTEHSIHILGEPPRQTHQSRIRAYKIGKFCRIVKAKPDAATKAIEAAIITDITELRGEQPYLYPHGMPVTVSIFWDFAYPKSAKEGQRKYWTWRTQRPDLDNLSKSILDALTAARAWADDNQVVDLRLVKLNSPQPGLTIKLREATIPLV